MLQSIYDFFQDNSFISLLEAASIVAAAGFGIFALLTEYKVDGKITWAGRIAIIGIIVSALLSFITKVAQADSDRDAAEDAEETARNRQIELLDNLDGVLTRLQGVSGNVDVLKSDNDDLRDSMSSSLALQETSLDRLENSADDLQALSGSQEANFSETLRALWYQANSVDLNTARIRLNILCRLEGLDSFPAIIDTKSTRAELKVISPEAEDYGIDLRRKIRGLGLKDKRFAHLTIRSDNAAYSELDRLTSERRQLNRIYDFRSASILSNKVEYWQNPDNWRLAIFQVTISSLRDPIRESLQDRFRPQSQPLPLRNPNFRPLDAKDYSGEWEPFPCYASVIVNIDGRDIYTRPVRLYETVNEAGAATILAYSGSERVSPTAFPAYREMGGKERAGE